MLLVVASWRLWFDLPNFPTVPVIRWYPRLAGPWIALGPATLVVGLGFSLYRRTARPALAATALLFVWLILGDQLRFQPWVYQFVVMAIVLALVPGRRTRPYCRAYLIALYAFSGLSKLDASFVREMGPLFIRETSRMTGFEIGGGSWVLILPGWEILVAVLLMFRSTRLAGFAGAVAMHAALICILGPTGLGHGPTVLIWNLALIAEGAYLFVRQGHEVGSSSPRTVREAVVRLAMGVVLMAPIVERWALLDSWPAHALYASHCEWSSIRIGAGDGFRRLPETLRLACEVPPGESTWRLDLTSWCRSARGVPAYPQSRYANGVAEWVARRIGPEGDVSVEHHLRADPLTARRVTIEARGLAAIHQLGDSFRINAHPQPDP